MSGLTGENRRRAVVNKKSNLSSLVTRRRANPVFCDLVFFFYRCTDWPHMLQGCYGWPVVGIVLT